MALYNKQFKWQDDVIHNIGLSFYKKDWVVKEIVYHPLKFAKTCMEDKTNDRSVRIRYFGAFTPKKVKTKERVNRFKFVYRNYDTFRPILISYGYDVDTIEKYHEVVKLIGIKNIRFIDKIYNKGSVINKDNPIMEHLDNNTI
jgi:hypothetical protein